MHSSNLKHTFNRENHLLIRSLQFLFLITSLSFCGCSGCSSTAQINLPLKFVGSSSCAACHANQARMFHGSDHDRAMELATEKTVLGDFNNQVTEHYGQKSKMFRRDGKYFANTQGPDGKNHDYEIIYTYGVYPLQQYLVELSPPTPQKKENAKNNEKRNPHSGPLGKIQVLPMAWDVRLKQWFYVINDEEIKPGDPLHWTGWGQTWNHMCAECHSVEVAKNHDLKTNTYHTTFKTMNVSCEACHGPASRHVAMAKNKDWQGTETEHYGLALTLKRGPVTKEVKFSKAGLREINTCAPCHSRRSTIYPGYQPQDELLDFHHVALLREDIYYPDGQVQDEVYVYGSFLQSKMYREGVRCSDCHNPHTAKLHFNGNRLCTQCHVPAKYDTPAHTHHQVDSTGSSCVECHMPHRKYMVVDERRDHSIRIPRPDVSLIIQSPNACVGCHLDPNKRTQADDYPKLLADAAKHRGSAIRKLDKLNQEAAESIEKWFGKERKEGKHYGETFALARRGHPRAEENLIRLSKEKKTIGPIVRATAVSLLGGYGSYKARQAVLKALSDDEPIVRAAAVGATLEIDNIGYLIYRKYLFPRLTDESRSVRIGIAQKLLSERSLHRDIKALESFQSVLKEFRTSLKMHTDMSQSHIGLSLLARFDGDLKKEEASLKNAIRLQPTLERPHRELAKFYDRTKRPTEAKKERLLAVKFLKRDLKIVLNSAAIHLQHAMMNYQLDNLEEAAKSMRMAANLSPYNSYYLILLTEIYQKQNEIEKIEDSIRKAIARVPDNPDYLIQLLVIYQQQKKINKAEQLAYQAIALAPDNSDYLIHLMSVYLQQKKADKAKQLILNAIRITPDDPRYLVNLMNFYLGQRDIKNAEASILKAIDLSPFNPGLFVHLMEIYLMQQQVAKAKQSILKAVSLAPDEPEYLVVLMGFYQRQKEIEKAFSIAKKILILHPKDPYATRFIINYNKYQKQ